ncbi:nicotinate phosphoribosyltransferase [Elasticomyces elasticus]|nr:nicotinate phosphoribosyltransferase [Elasticomyces elasticus]
MATTPPPDGIFSLLDTDLYKLTMQCAVLKHYPDVQVTYALTNRTHDMKLNRAAYRWLQKQIARLANIRLSDEEERFLREKCSYMNEPYYTFIRKFRFRPEEHVKMSFQPTRQGDTERDDEPGDVSLTTKGLWIDTILYEIPLLALTSEAYFKFVDTDWDHTDQVARAKDKALRLIRAGCTFSEFGSRRRRDYRTHEMVMAGLQAARREAQAQGKGWRGEWTGTSNVHLAMRFGVAPLGTVAHEWVMGIAAVTDDYAGANERALRCWVDTFGPGVLAIALTDTFGTAQFLDAFAKPLPPSSSPSSAPQMSYAQAFTGVRQDSGDPLAFVATMKSFYAAQGIREAKTIVFSDSLDVDRCIEYRAATEAAGLTPSFGVGTYFTNDFVALSSKGAGRKSVPLNIVVKLSSAAGRPAVKISDNVGKNTGDAAVVAEVKRRLGYTERGWECGDERARWGRSGGL